MKEVLLAQGAWSQYLEVGIGPDAEIFTKAQPMSAVGLGAEVGLQQDHRDRHGGHREHPEHVEVPTRYDAVLLSGFGGPEGQERPVFAYRLIAHYGWDDLIFTHLSARVPGPEHHFLINPYDMMFEEITASSLVKIDVEGMEMRVLSGLEKTVDWYLENKEWLGV